MTYLSKTLVALRVANEARQKEWDCFSKITLAYRCNELCGEAGEASNILKKIEREQLGIAGSRASRQQLAEELADVVICTDLVSLYWSIDLANAIPEYENLVKTLEDKTPSEFGCHLQSVSGYVATIYIGGKPLEPTDIDPLRLGLTGIIKHTRDIASHFGIVLPNAVTEKFNATSRKVGLTTMMEAA